MYFRVSLLLISNFFILTLQTQPPANAKGLGIASCTFLGSAKEDCNLPEVKITSIPQECTSIIFDGVFVDLNYHVYADPCTCVDNKKMMDNLDKALSACKPTYVYYGHSTQEEWTQVLSCEACDGGVNSLDEVKGLKGFLDEHKGITGIILRFLENDSSSIEFPGYSENLKKYLEVMKAAFPNLEIGIEFIGSSLVDQYTDPTIPWLDIKVIDPALDFYIISLVYLNDCTNDLRNFGISPMDSKSATYTMEKVKSVLAQACIPKEKTHFRFRLNPISDPNDSLTRCNLTMQEICVHPKNTCAWCSDTLASFNIKGNFAKENGVGFVTTNIDLNDATNLCKCEKPYISFYALLDGFNGNPTKPCDPLIR